MNLQIKMKEEELLRKLEESEYKLKLMEVFQNFLININKKLELEELANFITKFIKESFDVKFCSFVIYNKRFSTGKFNDEKILESEKRIIKEVLKNKSFVFVKSTKNDTLLHDIKNEIDLGFICLPVFNENKEIAFVNVYDDAEKI